MKSIHPLINPSTERKLIPVVALGLGVLPPSVVSADKQDDLEAPDDFEPEDSRDVLMAGKASSSCPSSSIRIQLERRKLSA